MYTRRVTAIALKSCTNELKISNGYIYTETMNIAIATHMHEKQWDCTSDYCLTNLKTRTKSDLRNTNVSRYT